MMRHYLSMWKHIFDYKGKSTREDYRTPLLVTAILAALIPVFLFVGGFFDSEWAIVVMLVVWVLFILHIPPMMALTVRRLRDAGRNPFWAVLSCLAGIGTIIVMLICLLSLSGFSPIDNIHGNVYGPPPEFYPEDNIETALYGPPEMLGALEYNTEEPTPPTATDAQEKETNEDEQP